VSFKVGIKDMLEAGVHFGHQTRRWNPKMKQFIFAEKNGIYIIDLQKSLSQAQVAYEAVRKAAATGAPVLFVGPKKQAIDIIREEAERCEQHYVIERWLGGLLTNFQTVRKSLDRLEEIETWEKDGTIEQFGKKERMQLTKKRARLQRMLGGIRKMDKRPGLIFVVDTMISDIAIKEARVLGIPVVALVDTNCDPDPIDYPIAANDDAIRSIKLFTRMVSEAVIEGRAQMKDKEAMEKGKAEKEAGEKAKTAKAEARVKAQPEAKAEEKPAEEPKAEPAAEEKPALDA